MLQHSDNTTFACRTKSKVTMVFRFGNLGLIRSAETPEQVRRRVVGLSAFVEGSGRIGENVLK